MADSRERTGGGSPAGRAEAQPGGSRLGILEELADFCVAAGEYGTAADYYEQMIDLARRLKDSGGALAEVHRKMAGCLRASGDYDRAMTFLQEAERLYTEQKDGVGLATILGEKAWIAVRQGNYDQAERDGLRALELVGDPGREEAAASALNCLGTVALRRGDWEKARETYEGALAIYRRLGDEERVARSLNNLGLVAKNQGLWDQALRYQQSAVAISRRQGQELLLAGQLSNLGITLFKRGDWSEASDAWEEAKGILERLGEKWEIAYVYTNLGNYARRVRRLAEAEGYYQRALETSERNGDVRGRALALEFLAALAADRGEADRARELYQEAFAIASGIAPRGDLAIELLRGLAETAVAAGDEEVASSLAHQGLALAAAAGDSLEEGCLARVLSRVARARGQLDEARQHIERSIQCLERLGEKYEFGRSLVTLAELLADLPDQGLAGAGALRRAEEAFRSLGADYELGHALLRDARQAVVRGDGRRAREAVEEGSTLLAHCGWPEPEESLRRLYADVDRCLASASVSEANDLASFVHLSAEINQLGDARERLRRVLELIGTRVGAQRGRLVLLGKNGGRPLLEHGWEAAGSEVPVPSSFARQVLAVAALGHEPLISTHPEGDPRLTLLERPADVRALLALPLRFEGRAVGGVYVDRCRPPVNFAQRDVDLAVALINLAAASCAEVEAGAAGRLRHFPEGECRDLSPVTGMVTRSPQLLGILETLAKLQNTEVTVLLWGETGTGKELLAQALHGDSGRPFVNINCAAMAEGVLESELFGHVRGAFTDAHQDKEGLFARAAGGTVFLDEIDKTSRNLQERLLRVVDKREFRPVGSNDFRRAEFRLVCATNKPLEKEVEEGRFLKDLYYRLKVVALRVPPLRERPEDIALLAEHFLALYSRKFGRRGLSFSSGTLDLLASYSWPGNVRDLEHEIERVVAFAADGDVLDPENFSVEVQGGIAPVDPAGSGGLSGAVERLERQMILEALRRFGGNRSQTARALGLSRRGLLNKIDRYRLD